MDREPSSVGGLEVPTTDAKFDVAEDPPWHRRRRSVVACSYIANVPQHCAMGVTSQTVKWLSFGSGLLRKLVARAQFGDGRHDSTNQVRYQTITNPVKRSNSM
eukprot:6031943-Pleurochrysis_carterae.AAC.2